MLSKEGIILQIKYFIENSQRELDNIDVGTSNDEIERINRDYQFWVANLYYLTKED